MMLNGRVPYRGVWDHKPPAIYLVNAAGLLLGGGSVWGVWVLEVISLGIATLLGFVLMQRAFGTLPAVWGSALWLGGLVPLLQGGNFTEEFILPLQFAMLFTIWKMNPAHRSRSLEFAFGLLFGVTLLFKVNVIGVQIGVLTVILIHQFYRGSWNAVLRSGVTCVAGVAVPLLFTLSVFTLFGSIHFLIDQTLTYGFSYSHSTLGSRWSSIKFGISSLEISEISRIGLLAWTIGVVRCLVLALRRETLDQKDALLLAVIIALPIELLSTGLSGRPYPHYFMTLLPVLAVLAAYIAKLILSVQIPGHFYITSARIDRLRRVLIVCVLVVFISRPSHLLAWQIKNDSLNSFDETRKESATFVKQTTNSNDYVLTWGNETVINFLSKRRAPTAYVYQYPLVTIGYESRGRTQQFLTDLSKSPPKVIVDGSAGTGYPPIDTPDMQDLIGTLDPSYKIPAGLVDAQHWIEANYTVVAQVGLAGWKIYVNNRTLPLILSNIHSVCQQTPHCLLMVTTSASWGIEKNGNRS
jgi:hypothetical protein